MRHIAFAALLVAIAALSMNLYMREQGAVIPIEQSAQAGAAIDVAKTSSTALPITPLLSVRAAQDIAETSAPCSEKGSVHRFLEFDTARGIWLFALTTNDTRDGCIPLCVVDDRATKGLFAWKCGMDIR